MGEFGNGAQTLGFLRQEPVDVLLIDIEMPDMNGIDVVKQIGGRAPLSTIFVTAYPEHAVDAFELHALDYLTKPVKPERAKRAMVEPSDPSNVTHREDGCGFTLDFYLAEAKTIYLARRLVVSAR